MKEPCLMPVDPGPYVPFSQLPRAELEFVAYGGEVELVKIYIDEAFDIDFMRIYAARLLRERS